MIIDEESPLDIALRLAADGPAHRPDFYKKLLESTVYILAKSENQIEGAQTIALGEKISIQNWEKNDGSPVIPFFSTLIKLQTILDKETSYLALPARSLFEITKGSSLVLNPKLKYGKEFFPNEIEALLTDNVNRLAEPRVTQKETQVLLGQPANYPSKMVESLTAFFSIRNNVKAAYLAMMHDSLEDEKPRLIVGIEVDGDHVQTIKEAGVVAGDTNLNGEPVDLIRVDPNEQGLGKYFKRDVKPFYERSWGGKLKYVFGIGHA